MFIELDRNSRIPMKKQLYDAITTRILKGELAEGERLPSTRELADKLGIARNTVIEIYEQLVAEAYLEAHQGKGLCLLGYDRTAVSAFPAVKRQPGSSAGTEVT